MTKQEAIELVSLNGVELQSLSVEFRDDPEVVREAIHGLGTIQDYQILLDIQGLSTVMKHNGYVQVYRQFGEFGNSFEYASPRLRGDREFSLELAKKNEFILPFVSINLWKDLIFVSRAVEIASWSLSFADKNLLKNKQLTDQATTKWSEGQSSYRVRALEGCREGLYHEICVFFDSLK
jgi:hypothetical protein